ncbi:MAG: hypothetical protein HeimC3_46240 [Candidatus Heimdallarchaeota archaeon LC_3]|nr:MAG: hypothetical protein HeimC3_46240 [Candidatus Heimdallarchaeota archaeon LC_3]
MTLQQFSEYLVIFETKKINYFEEEVFDSTYGIILTQ